MPVGASAQNMTMPEINAFLPNITEVRPSEPMAIDGLWKVSTIDKRGGSLLVDSLCPSDKWISAALIQAAWGSSMSLK
jgi:hypothetical protein